MRIPVLVVVLAVSALGADDATDRKGAKSLFLDTQNGSLVAPVGPGSARKAGSGRGSQEPATATDPRSRAGSSAAVQPAPIGVMYWIELQAPNGQLLRVTANRAFKSGERIRIHVVTNVNGHLSMLQSQDDGPFAALSPTAGAASNAVTASEETVLPSRNGWFRFDEKPGKIRLLLMMQGGRAPEPLLAQAAPPPPPLNSADIEAQIHAQMSKLNGSKALVIEEDSASAEPASYVVVDRRRDQTVAEAVATEITLRHESNR